MSHAFLSYSRDDADIANLLRQELEHAGVEIWMDTKNQRVGDVWRNKIRDAIENAFCFILLHSKASAESDAVTQEIDAAKSTEHKVPIIPLAIDSHPMRIELESVHACSMTGIRSDPPGCIASFVGGMRELSRAIEKESPALLQLVPLLLDDWNLGADAICPTLSDVEDVLGLKFEDYSDPPRTHESLPSGHVQATHTHEIELRNRAREGGYQYFNEPLLELSHVDHSENPDSEVQSYTMRWSKSSYLLFKTYADRLGDLAEPSGQTIREALLTEAGLRADWAPKALTNLIRSANCPVPARIATVTVPVFGSGPGQQLLFAEPRAQLDMTPEEAKRREHSEALSLHFIGGGAIPGDVQFGPYNPRDTASRELKKELGGIADPHKIKLVCTGVFVDKRRWQPVFTYVALFNRNDVEHVDLSSLQAVEGAENAAFYPVAATTGGLFDLLLRTSPRIEGIGTIRLATNHAAAALLAGLVYLYGREVVVRKLLQRVGPGLD